MKLFSALKNRRFALLFAGQSTSRIGDHLYQLALAWWVLKKTGSALDMGAVMICSFTPMLIFLLIGGVAVDRLHRIGIMLASDAIRAILVFVVAGLALAGTLEVWHIFFASLLFGFVDAFFNPAFAAALPDLVSPDQLNSANALTSLGTQFGRIAGPALGAIIVGTVGTGWAFAFDGFSFIISAACLVPLISGEIHVMAPVAAVESPLLVADASPIAIIGEHRLTEPGGLALYREVRDGIRFVLGKPWLWGTILTCTAANVLLGGPFSVTLPFLVQKTRGWEVGTLGLIYAMFPVGYAIAAVVSGQLKVIHHRGLVIFASMALAGAAIVVIGVEASLPAILLAAIVNGFALELAGLAWTQVMQEKVPSDMLGRVSSIDSLGSFALLPLGYGIAGLATDHLSAPLVFVAGGTATCAIALAGMASRSIRNLD